MAATKGATRSSRTRDDRSRAAPTPNNVPGSDEAAITNHTTPPRRCPPVGRSAPARSVRRSQSHGRSRPGGHPARGPVRAPFMRATAALRGSARGCLAKTLIDGQAAAGALPGPVDGRCRVGPQSRGLTRPAANDCRHAIRPRQADVSPARTGLCRAVYRGKLRHSRGIYAGQDR